MKNRAMKICAAVNQKGGAAKTTEVFHLAHHAVEQGLKVLLVDFDRQRSLSHSFLATEGAEPGLLASALFSPDPLALKPEVLSENLHIIRADADALSLLMDVDRDMMKQPARHLRSMSGDYDLCIIDTPGAIGFNPPITAAALIAADGVFCPFPLGLYEALAVQDLWDFIQRVRTQGFNPRLKLLGLVPSRVNTKSAEELAGLAELRKAFGAAIFPLMLPERAAVKQAVMRRTPVWRKTRGQGSLLAAREWRAVMDALLVKIGVKK